MKPFALLVLTLLPLSAGILVDRIAVVVDKRVLKSSDIDRDLRVTAFINRQPVESSPAARRKAAERLVDQEIIRQELSAQGYSRPVDSDAQGLLQQIATERFHGSTAQLQAALARYELAPDLLREALLWQLTVLSFIDQRFRPGILVTDEEIQTYYNQHLADLKREYPRDSTFQALAPKIRTSLEGQRIDQEFDAWLDQARKRTRIVYKEAAFE